MKREGKVGKRWELKKEGGEEARWGCRGRSGEYGKERGQIRKLAKID